MTKLAFITDPHLDHAKTKQVTALCNEVANADPDAIVITGDIAQANSIFKLLPLFHAAVRKPIYFVLGNHDYYMGHTTTVRREIVNMCESNPDLHYMRENSIKLNNGWSIVGVDGWADAQYGTPERQKVVIADWSYIRDYSDVFAELPFNLHIRMDLARKYAAVEAELLSKQLDSAIKEAANVLVLTHIPPFPGATWHAGKQSDNDWLPWFSCKATGDVLMQYAQDNPDRNFKVLCGHTHGMGHYAPLRNLEVVTGGSIYGFPKIHEVITL